MSRIGGPATGARVQSPQTPELPKPAQAAPTAPAAASPQGFSAVSSFRSAAQGFDKLTPNDLGVLAQNQGHTNACGTTSLANVMTYWGMPRTHEQIDHAVRAFDIFSAPDKLVSYARDNGLRAELKNDSSLNDIAHAIDQGTPPIVLIDPDNDKNANLHYVSVTGYNRDASGKVSELAIADSAGGYRYTVPAADFQKQWDKLKMDGVGTGLNNVMITTAPKDNRPVTGGDGVTRNASQLQLPTSSLLSTLKSAPAREAANVLAVGAHVAEDIWKAFS
jgi:hypothetical protein